MTAGDLLPITLLINIMISDMKDYTVEQYGTCEKNVWCPGCGNYSILQAMKMAFSDLKLEREKVVSVSGIGCSSQMPHWLNVNGFHSIHGRALPVATGMHLANPELTVIVNGGDGDGYGIGMGHFMHAMRRNLNITYIVHDNQIYGLTKGQASPTSEKGHITASTPDGSPDNPVYPMQIAIAGGATFVARGSAANLLHLKELIKKGIQHEGFSLIDILQPCVTFNKINTYGWLKEKTYELADDAYDKSNYLLALEKSLECGEKIPIGIFYDVKKSTHCEDMGINKRKPVVYNDSQPDISDLLESYK